MYRDQEDGQSGESSTFRYKIKIFVNSWIQQLNVDFK